MRWSWGIGLQSGINCGNGVRRLSSQNGHRTKPFGGKSRDCTGARAVPSDGQSRNQSGIPYI